MKELNLTAHFNHGYLCEMLRNASDTELANVIEDVKKIQAQREEALYHARANTITDSIKQLVNSNYSLIFMYKYDSIVINKDNVNDYVLTIKKEN